MSHDFNDCGNGENSVFGNWHEDLIEGGREVTTQKVAPKPQPTIEGVNDTRDFSMFTVTMASRQARKLEEFSKTCQEYGIELNRQRAAFEGRIQQLEGECVDLIGRLKTLVTAEAVLTTKAAQCVHLICTYGGNSLPNVFNLLNNGGETSYEAELAELEHRLNLGKARKVEEVIESLLSDPLPPAGQERGA